MAANRRKQYDYDELRRLAEERLAEGGGRSDAGVTENDLLRLVYELDVHQIELELQNEELRRAHHEAEEAKDRYFELYDLAPVGYLTLNADGTVLEANLTAARMLGTERQRLVGARFWFFVAPHALAELRQFVGGVLTTNAKASTRVVLAKEDGAEFHAHLEGIAKTESSGVPVECRIALIDIAEQVRAEQRTTNVLSSISDAFFTLDHDWRFAYVNAEAERLLRKPRSELLGEHIWDLFPEAVGSRFQEGYERAIAEQVTVEVTEFYPPFNAWFEVRAYPSPEGLSVYFLDVTDRRLAQERQELIARILGELNRRTRFEDSIQEIVRFIKEFSGVEATAIRLREGDDFPYLVAEGFREQFLQKERSLLVKDEAGNTLCDGAGRAVLDCMCGNIALGRIDLGQSFFTPEGSFWTNSTSELLATTSEEDRQGRTRNHCNAEGYESLALIPLRMDQEILGILQLADRRTGCFTLDQIEHLEGIAASIGIALAQKQAEEALRTSERRYRTLFESMAEGFALCEIILDDSGKPCDWRYLEVNHAFEVNTGLKADQVVGKAVSEVLPNIEPHWIEAYGPVALTGQPIRFENYVQDLGKYFEVFAFRPAEGQFAALFVDVTERKAAEQLLEKYQMLSQNSRDIILFIRRDGPIIEANDAAVTAYGYTRDELLSLTIFDLRAPETLDEIGKQLASADAGGIVFETIHRRKDGSTFAVEVSSRGADIGKERVLLSIIRDITVVTDLQRIVQHNLTLLQKALAVSEPEIGAGYAVAVRYVPAFAGQEIGGDFYDVFVTEDGRTAVVIGDVSGKGIPAAALAASTRSTIRAFAYELSATDLALSHTNAIVRASEAATGNFVTAILMIIDRPTGAVQYSIAGHPPLALLRVGVPVEFLQGGSPPIGIEDAQAFAAGSVHLNPGDKIILYTDGLTEARRRGELFDLEGVERSLDVHCHESPESIAAALVADAREWAEGLIQDDVAVLVIERLPG